MFKKILVVCSDKKTSEHLETKRIVKNILIKNKIDFLFLSSEVIKEKNFYDVDLVITLGGDGTFVKASGFVENQKILGINSDNKTSEGALTSLSSDKIDKLNEILAGNFSIINRERAIVKKNGLLLRGIVLDIIYVGTVSQFHASRYIISYKGNKEEQRSSGVLISTGSGSTGWYKSAGGKPFEYDSRLLKFLIREPYIGKNLFKPKILGGEIRDGEKIEIESTKDFGGIVVLDNDEYPFNRGEKIEVMLSDKPLKEIVLV